jgi:hypothetical protein
MEGVKVPLQKSDSTTNTTLKEMFSFPLIMVILSIDVGIKNLAMCLIEEESTKVLQWDVSGVPPQHRDGLFPCLRDHLDEKPWVLTATTVLIEKQPGMNKTMKTVENFLHSYFVIKNPTAETIIYDARHKVPDVAGAGKARYRQRKQVSVDRCREFIEGSEVNKHWMPTFVASKKKDDLADTVLQALSYINRRIVGKGTSSKKSGSKGKESSAEYSGSQKKIVARKPNENQKATKYSIPNLIWLARNEPHEKLKSDKRFMKDLLRSYKSFEEFTLNI